MSDFTYSFNEPMARAYFWHPAYDNYPVVGVSWRQARAFCVWRTELLNSYYLESMGEPFVQEYRLPTESEWEYAARGGLKGNMYPWGGYYTQNYKGCYVANLNQCVCIYTQGGIYMLVVAHYDPNEYGLYDMGGNVSEWTSNAFEEAAYSYNDDLNPDYTYEALPDDPPVRKRKIIRGGHGKIFHGICSADSRTYNIRLCKSYIGFRCVRSYLGRDFRMVAKVHKYISNEIIISNYIINLKIIEYNFSEMTQTKGWKNFSLRFTELGLP
jgi:gliding motility-associated lipoprotein GldK